MMNLLAELKRRQMFRVAAAYAVVAWLLLQIVNNVAPVLDLPIWVARAFLLALVIGFPIALLFVWMRDLAPADASAPKPATTKLDYALIGALVLVIALVSHQQFAPSREAGTQPAGIATVPPAAPSAAISIAVLPFANVSGDPSQEFFSDGMSDEIIAALAKIPSLQVVARTSAFQFKGERNDMRAIGQVLNARYLIDGSVRRAGNRVRITAQLVQADNGVGVWTDSYDRELTDVFAIQEDIAEAIAAALRVPLGLQQGERLVSNRTDDLESYQEFLRARALYRARDLSQAIVLLESIVAREPNYAPAWALLSWAQRLVVNRDPNFRQGSVEEARRLVEAARGRSERSAREAMRLDPKYPGSLFAQAGIEGFSGRYAVAEDLYRQALALDPSDPDILDRFSSALSFVARNKEALELRERLRSLEPFVPYYNIATADVMQRSGQNEAAISLLQAVAPESADEFGRYLRTTALARAYAALGRFDDAADVLVTLRSTLVSRQALEDAARFLRQAPANVGLQDLPELEAGLDFVYVHVGAPQRVLDAYERGIEIYGSGGFFDFASPAYSGVRKTERFKILMRRARLVDYWRAKGWPDLCRPIGADDFECD